MGRRAVLLIAALVVAAVGTTMVFLYVNGVNDRALAKQKPVRVLVAKTEIPAGTSVEDANASASFERKTISRDSLVDGAVSATTGMRGQVAKTTIYPGEQILPQKFGDPGAISSLDIDPDMSSITVPISDPAVAAGFVVPGMTVALYLNAPGKNGGPGQVELLLSGVRVLATGNKTTVPADSATEDDSSNGSTSSSLTFEVDQTQYQRILFASTHGQLFLALLGKDFKPGPQQATTLENLTP